MDEARPARRVYVTLAGQEWEIVPTDKLTIPEIKEAKTVSGGMALADLEEAFQKADPDAWVAMLYVSMKRRIPVTTVKDVLELIGDTPLLAVIETLRQEAPESANADPPTSPSEPDINGSEPSSGGETLQHSTLATSGPPN